MLQTTFCKTCGKFYDASLSECPICARKRMEEQAMKLSGKAPAPKPMTVAEKVRAAVAVKEDATVMLSAEEINAAAEAVRKQVGEEKKPENETAEPVKEKKSRPALAVMGGTAKLVAGAAVVMLLVVFCVGMMNRKPSTTKPSAANSSQSVTQPEETSNTETPVTEEQTKPDSTTKPEDTTQTDNNTQTPAKEEDTKPDTTTTEQTKPDSTTTEQTKPDTTTTEQTKPDTTTTEQTKPDTTTTEQTKPDTTTTEQTKPDDTTTEQTKPDDTTTEQTKPDTTPEETPDEPAQGGDSDGGDEGVSTNSETDEVSVQSEEQSNG